jgi:hypothetical protein
MLQDHRSCQPNHSTPFCSSSRVPRRTFPSMANNTCLPKNRLKLHCSLRICSSSSIQITSPAIRREVLWWGIVFRSSCSASHNNSVGCVVHGRNNLQLAVMTFPLPPIVGDCFPHRLPNAGSNHWGFNNEGLFWHGISRSIERNQLDWSRSRRRAFLIMMDKSLRRVQGSFSSRMMRAGTLLEAIDIAFYSESSWNTLCPQ